VVSVGDLVYLAMAKGGLNPFHILICPVAHHRSYVECPEDTKKEIEKYKQCLQKAFQEDGKSVVFFERNYRSNHLQIQVVPLPSEISSDTVKNSFFSLARSNKDKIGKPRPLDLAEIPKRTEIHQMVPQGVPYFHAEMPDGARLLPRIEGFFPLQFGR
jgi:diadenosine tetraphosphate (Ap4A) HIT family hydrolase